MRRRQNKPRGKTAGRAKKTGRSQWKPFLIALPVALIVPALVGYLYAVYIMFPPTDESAGGIAVPSLIGQSASDAQRDLAALGLGEIVPEELPHPNAPAGQVVAQSPLAGQQLRAGATVRVALSSGPPRALVPDVIGFSAARAESLLRRAGFEVTVVRQDDNAPADRVLSTEPARGQESVLPSTITIIVSEGPAQPAPLVPADSVVLPPVPPDTTRALSR